MKRYALSALMALLCFLVGLLFLVIQNPVHWAFMILGFIYTFLIMKLED